MRSRTTRTAVVFLVAVAVCLAWGVASAGKVQQDLAAESTLEQVLRRGVMRVGISTFVPWAMKDKTGQLIGFEIDVASRLAKDMGVKAEFVPTKWAGMIPALLTGKFDIIIGGMGIRPDRNLKVNFSIPYDYTGMSMAAHRERASGFNTLESFDRPDVAVAARLGSTAATAAKQFLPKAELRLFDEEAQAYQELLNGRVHAVVGSAPTPALQVLKHPDRLFLPFKETFTREPIGFAVRKGDPDTLNYLDNWIRVVEAEGWLRERKRYWFEGNGWESRLQ
jgi:polar amino acid transport system substrate-binding protein